jgi:DNA polymerase I-like protein with 3'-5' exonuclease and polymerase domains
MRIVFDIEADGLHSTVTKIHCIVAKDVDTQRIYKFYDGDRFENQDQTIHDFVRFFDDCTTIIGHNIITYDIPILARFLGISAYGKEVIDTLVWSQVLNPDRQLHKKCPTSHENPLTKRLDKITPHSLAAWGYRVGRGKPEHYDWSVFTTEMLHRCTEDVEIQTLVYDALLKEVGTRQPWFKVFKLESKVAEIIFQQEVNGFKFDLDKAHNLIRFTEDKRDSLYQQIRPSLSLEISSYGVEVSKPFKKNGEYTKAVVDWFDEELPDVSGPFTRISFEEPDIGSRQKLIKQLLKHGWKPDLFTDKGQPKLTEAGVPVKTLEAIDGEIGKLISEWYTLGHRQSQVQGWINNTRVDERISARANTCGTNTARMRHSVVVNVPKADPSVMLGYEMRDLFTVDRGHCLCGHDAAALEARVMAHYTTPIDGGEFAKEILSGDIHSSNTRKLFPKEVEGYNKGDDVFNKYRSWSKNIFYALIYGAQPQKISSMLGCNQKQAKALFESFWKENPGLGILREKVIAIHEKNGWVQGIDGRKVYTRATH